MARARCARLRVLGVSAEQATELGRVDPNTDPDILIPPDEAALATAAAEVGRSFEALSVDTATWLALIGSERFFGDRSNLVRRPAGTRQAGFGGPRYELPMRAAVTTPP